MNVNSAIESVMPTALEDVGVGDLLQKDQTTLNGLNLTVTKIVLTEPFVYPLICQGKIARVALKVWYYRSRIWGH